MSHGDEKITIGPGSRLGRYQLLLGIAKGGMGKVWAARLVGHMGFRRLVAVKTVLHEHTENARFEQMFLDEARLAALIQHPNVCAIYELAEDNGVLYLAMEWVNGEALNTLRRATETKKLPLPLAARIIAQACAGLHAAHELRSEDGEFLAVVHRDVSPHNLLVSVDGHVKVVDFGIAKARGQMHAPTATGEVKGKIHYMAPEQLTSTSVDRRADIFALGCVLYEVTLGRVPFEGDNMVVMFQLVDSTVTPPIEIDPSYPEELNAIVVKALERNPADRFQTAEELRIALEQWLAHTQSIVTDLDVAAWVKSVAQNRLDDRQRAIREATAELGSELGGSPGDGIPQLSESGASAVTKPRGGRAGSSSGARPVRARTASSSGENQAASDSQGIQILAPSSPGIVSTVDIMGAASGARATLPPWKRLPPVFAAAALALAVGGVGTSLMKIRATVASSSADVPAAPVPPVVPAAVVGLATTGASATPPPWAAAGSPSVDTSASQATPATAANTTAGHGSVRHRPVASTTTKPASAPEPPAPPVVMTPPPTPAAASTPSDQPLRHQPTPRPTKRLDTDNPF